MAAGSAPSSHRAPCRIPWPWAGSCRLIICGLIGALYVPADNQASFQTAAYFSHQLPLSARLATGIHMDGMRGERGCHVRPCTVDSWTPRIGLDEVAGLSGPDREVDEIMVPGQQLPMHLEMTNVHRRNSSRSNKAERQCRETKILRGQYVVMRWCIDGAHSPPAEPSPATTIRELAVPSPRTISSQGATVVLLPCCFREAGN